MPSPRSLPRDLPRLALALAAVLALPAAGATGSHTDLIFLAMLVAPAFVAVAALAPAPAGELIGGAISIELAAWTLPAEPGRSVVVLAVAMAMLIVAIARRLRVGPTLAFGELVLIAIALQALARGDVLIESGFTGRTAAILLLWPLVAAGATWILGRRLGGWGLLAASALFAAQGGLHVANTAALAIIAALAWLLPLPDFRRRPVPTAAAALASIAAVSALVAGYPWRHSRPLRATLALPGEALRAAGSRPLLDGGGLALVAARPSWETDLGGARAGAVVVVSNLTHGAALAAGTPAVELEATTTSGEQLRWTLRVGADTGEWAARRLDVAALQPAAPAAWQSTLADGFFAQRYRSEHRFAAAKPLERLAVRRAAELPAETEVALFWLEIR